MYICIYQSVIYHITRVLDDYTEQYISSEVGINKE